MRQKSLEFDDRRKYTLLSNIVRHNEPPVVVSYDTGTIGRGDTMNSERISAAEVGVPVASENLYSLRDGIYAGAIAGLSMTLAMAAWGAITGNGIWYPVNLIAGTVFPEIQTVPVEVVQQFNLTWLLVGTLIHFVISVTLGLVFDLLLPTLPGNPILWALIIGPVLWIGAEYAVLPLLNERLSQVMNGQTFIVAHLVYSVVLGLMIMQSKRLEPTSTGVSA